jgi:hypothetical protein
MSIPIHISRVVVNVVLDVLFPLLLIAAGGSHEAARQAAMDMLAEYHPNSAEELGLAGEIIAFRLNALGALRDSSVPGAPLAAMLALLKIAATLRRNETAAQRKLDALQRARRIVAKNADTKLQAAASSSKPLAPTASAAALSPAPPSAAPAETPSAHAVATKAQAQPAPAHAAATPAPRSSHIDAFVQRLTADLTGRDNGRREGNKMLAEIATAFSRGDHRGVLNAVAGPRSAAVSEPALLRAA